ncbi:MAG TPA: hypothetical protein VK813_12865 [Edaphobacter sp.]|nr:hypothetical protein [Edaphobacter sp.]
MKKIIKSALKRLKRWLVVGDAHTTMLQNRQLLGRMASWQVRSQRVISSLQEVEFQVSSQCGEDGIIDWLIERLGIPPELRSFVELGVENYREANTRFLLQNRNWRGLIMDSSSAMVVAAREDALSGAHDLTVLPAFITRENINDLIANAGFGGDIGLLSIDLDGNDYWVWEAVHAVNPVLCIVEYNAVFGDVHPISTPYDRNFNRIKAHHSYLYFGASIAALRSLATKKGYRFVGTNSSGNDAFFVREDYAKSFVDSSLQQIQALPSFFRESRDRFGRRNYIGGIERLNHIAEMPVVDIETSKTLRLGDLEPIYSNDWLKSMTGKAANYGVSANSNCNVA